jgi:hypothetical protein
LNLILRFKRQRKTFILIPRKISEVEYVLDNIGNEHFGPELWQLDYRSKASLAVLPRTAEPEP